MDDIVEKLRKDNRFYIDEFNLTRISGGGIRDYKIDLVKVSDILMRMEQGIITLDKTDVYRYLDGGSQPYKRYKEYCEKYGKYNPKRTVEEYDKLISTFSYEGYDLKKGAIFIDEFNIVCEGQHRLCILLKQFGADQYIKVVRLYYKGFQIKKRLHLLRFYLSRYLKMILR